MQTNDNGLSRRFYTSRILYRRDPKPGPPEGVLHMPITPHLNTLPLHLPWRGRGSTKGDHCRLISMEDSHWQRAQGQVMWREVGMTTTLNDTDRSLQHIMGLLRGRLGAEGCVRGGSEQREWLVLVSLCVGSTAAPYCAHSCTLLASC